MADRNAKTANVTMMLWSMTLPTPLPPAPSLSDQQMIWLMFPITACRHCEAFPSNVEGIIERTQRTI
jgi:hypothetical protein